MWNYIKVKQLTRTSPNYTIYKELIKNVLNLWDCSSSKFFTSAKPGREIFYVYYGKSERERAGAYYRNRKWEAGDFEQV